MTLRGAIRENQQRLAELHEASQHQLSMYQTGHIDKEEHNAIQSAINTKRLAIQLGIEALERQVELRNYLIKKTGVQIDWTWVAYLVNSPLPSEEEK